MRIINLGQILEGHEKSNHELTFHNPFNLESISLLIQGILHNDGLQAGEYLFFIKANLKRTIYELSRMGDRLSGELTDILIGLPTLNDSDCFLEVLDDSSLDFLTCEKNILPPGKAMIVGDSHIHISGENYPQIYPNQELFDNANDFVNTHGGDYILFKNSIIGASKLGSAHLQGQPSYSQAIVALDIPNEKRIGVHEIRDYVHRLNRAGIPNTVVALGKGEFALMTPDYFLGTCEGNPFTKPQVDFSLIPSEKFGYPLMIEGKISDYQVMAKELSDQIGIGGFELWNTNTVFIKDLTALLWIEKQLKSKGEATLRGFLSKLLSSCYEGSTLKLRIDEIIGLGNKFIELQSEEVDRNGMESILEERYSKDQNNIITQVKELSNKQMKQLLSYLYVTGDIQSGHEVPYDAFPNPPETEYIYNLCRGDGPISAEQIRVILQLKEQNAVLEVV